MSILKILNPRTVALFAFGSIVAVSVSGFAATNVVPNASVGDGSNTISGYTLTNVVYNLNAANPSNVDSVGFDISPVAASTVKAKLAGTWYNCVNGGGAVTCTTAGATVAAATSLQVVASQ